MLGVATGEAVSPPAVTSANLAGDADLDVGGGGAGPFARTAVDGSYFGPAGPAIGAKTTAVEVGSVGFEEGGGGGGRLSGDRLSPAASLGVSFVSSCWANSSEPATRGASNDARLELEGELEAGLGWIDTAPNRSRSALTDGAGSSPISSGSPEMGVERTMLTGGVVGFSAVVTGGNRDLGGEATGEVARGDEVKGDERPGASVGAEIPGEPTLGGRAPAPGIGSGLLAGDWLTGDTDFEDTGNADCGGSVSAQHQGTHSHRCTALDDR